MRMSQWCGLLPFEKEGILQHADLRVMFKLRTMNAARHQSADNLQIAGSNGGTK